MTHPTIEMRRIDIATTADRLHADGDWPWCAAGTRTHDKKSRRRASVARATSGRVGWIYGLITILTCSTTCACRGSGAYVWVNEAPDKLFEAAPTLTISPGDIISVRVFGQDPVSVKATVRPDGAIAMPLVGEIAVAGKSPSLVAKEVEAKLAPYFTAPNVVVVVEESRVRIVAIGEVNRNGTIVLDAGETGILPALANAGGLTQYASDSEIYVLRQEGNRTVRVRFHYDDIIRGVGKAGAFRLRTGDQLVVE